MKKMKGFATKVLTLVLAVALALGTNGVRAFAVDAGEAEETTAAYRVDVAEAQPAEGTTAPEATTGPAIIVNPVETEEPVAEKEMDYYMVFSIAKADRVDKSSGTTFDGLKKEDYFQVLGVDDSDSRVNPINKAHKNDTQKKIGRYNLLINEAEIDDFMTAVLTEVVGPTETVTQLNETDGNKIVAYPVERTEEQSSKRGMVEAVLTKMGVLDTVTANVKKFVRNKSNSKLQKYLKDVYPEVNFDNDDWYIDWYVMKTQDNGIHVDGVFVTIYDLDEWTVVYNFQKEYGSEEYERKPLEEKIRVEKDVTPDFPDTDNKILDPSEVDEKYDDAKYTLKVNEEGKADIDFTGNKTIEIYYNAVKPAEPVIEYVDWTVTYTFLEGEELVGSITLEDKIENIVEGERPEFGTDDDIKNPSQVDPEKYANADAQWTLKRTAEGKPVITFFDDDRNIEIIYEKNVSEEKKDDDKKDDEKQEDPNKNDDPQQNDDPKEEPTTPVVPKNPTFVPDEPEKEVTVEETPAEEPKEELPVEEPATPEGTPEEEIPVDEIPGTPEGAPEEEEIPVDEVPGTPEGAPEEEEEEEIPVDLPATPEGDVLPQTGVAGAATFFGFGAAFIGLGAAVIRKGIRREEI